MKMQTYDFGNPDARVVLIEPIHTPEGMDREADFIRELSGADFFLRAVKVDWFIDLSPWKAPAVFRDTPFGDGAPETLGRILELAADPAKEYVIGGYSMGGLFALWASMQTDRFRGAAAVSPSVWFPGFAEYAASRPVRAGQVYLSLGDREEKTRNPVMSAVGARIRELHKMICAQGVSCCLEWNEGNHFRDPDLRTAKGFAWVLKRLHSAAAETAGSAGEGSD